MKRAKKKTIACPRMSVRQNGQKGIAMVNPNRITHDAPELRDVLLGFLESASSLCDMMNTTMAAVLNEIMSIQADEACGAGYGERSDTRVNRRNGYRKRDLDTTVGTLPLMVPKLRSGSYFPTDLFERWSRTARALAAAVAEMYVTGTSTRKVEKVAARFGVESLSKDQVSRLCAVIDGEVDAFLAKDWSGMRFAYLFLDATYVSCRVGGRVRKRPSSPPSASATTGTATSSASRAPTPRATRRGGASCRTSRSAGCATCGSSPPTPTTAWSRRSARSTRRPPGSAASCTSSATSSPR